MKFPPPPAPPPTAEEGHAVGLAATYDGRKARAEEHDGVSERRVRRRHQDRHLLGQGAPDADHPAAQVVGHTGVQSLQSPHSATGKQVTMRQLSLVGEKAASIVI